MAYVGHYFTDVGLQLLYGGSLSGTHKRNIAKNPGKTLQGVKLGDKKTNPGNCND